MLRRLAERRRRIESEQRAGAKCNLISEKQKIFLRSGTQTLIHITLLILFFYVFKRSSSCVRVMQPSEKTENFVDLQTVVFQLVSCLPLRQQKWQNKQKIANFWRARSRLYRHRLDISNRYHRVHQKFSSPSFWGNGAEVNSMLGPR